MRGEGRLYSVSWQALWASGLSIGCLWPVGAYAEAVARINAGDTAWVLVASALVLMIAAPGLVLC